MSRQKILEPNDFLDDLRLSLVEGIGPMLSRRLLARFSSAEAVLSASRSDLQEVDGIGPKLSEQIVAVKNSDLPERVLECCRREGISIIHRDDSRYSEPLSRIPDPPAIYYQRGEILESDTLSLAVVGTRAMTSYGRRMARYLTGALVDAGLTIVSGLARGIDGVAHEIALQKGGRTIAVLGSGLCDIFPREHRALADQISRQGAVCSEFSPWVPPRAGNFPQRNRLVSGMALGVLVIESPLRSGSLITARLGMEQNREVFAVPGPVDGMNSKGCHRLIRDGAVLVETVDDILEALGPLVSPVHHPECPVPVRIPVELKLSDKEKNLLKYIGTAPTSIEEIIQESGLPPHQILSLLAALELKQIVHRSEGNSVYR